MADWAGNDTGSANDVNSSPGADVGSSSASGSSSGESGNYTEQKYGSGTYNPSTGVTDYGDRSMSSGEIAATISQIESINPVTTSGRTDPYATELASLGSRVEQERYLSRNDDPLAGAGIGNKSLSASGKDMSGQYLNRPDIYQPTDVRQLELMKSGLTAGQAAEQLRYDVSTPGRPGYTPGKADDRYFETLRTQAWTSATGESAGYHSWAKDTGLPQTGNPYEYGADLFTYAEKGYPTADKDRFSPIDYSILNLAGGKGGQAFIWSGAPYDLRGAMDVVAGVQRSGDMGIYGQTRSSSSGFGDLPIGTQQAIGMKAADSRGEYYNNSVWSGVPTNQMLSGLGYRSTYEAPALRSSSTPQQVLPFSTPSLGGGVTATTRNDAQVAASMEAMGYPLSPNLVGGGKVASTATTVSNLGDMGLPKPFMSGGGISVIDKPSGEFDSSRGFLQGLLPQITPEQASAYATANKSNPMGAVIDAAVSGTRYGKSAALGAFSEITGGLSETIFPAEKFVSQKAVPAQYTWKETTEQTGGSAEQDSLYAYLTSTKNSIDVTDIKQVNKYNEARDRFLSLEASNPTKIVTTQTPTLVPGTGIEEERMNQWKLFSRGSGEVGRYLTGETIAKQNAYYETIKNDSSMVGEAKRAVFFAGTTAINNPAALAPAAIQGAAFVYGGGALGAGVGYLATGTGRAANVASMLMTPGGQTAVKTVVALGFGGLYTKGITEDFTLRPGSGKISENVYKSIPTLAAMYAGGGGIDWVGETRVVNRVTPSGGTVRGIDINNQFFGGGTTPAGRPYAAVGNIETGFSSFVFERRVTSGGNRVAGEGTRQYAEPASAPGMSSEGRGLGAAPEGTIFWETIRADSTPFKTYEPVAVKNVPSAQNMVVEPVGVGDRYVATKSPLGKNTPMVMEQMWKPGESVRPTNIGDSFLGGAQSAEMVRLYRGVDFDSPEGIRARAGLSPIIAKRPTSDEGLIKWYEGANSQADIYRWNSFGRWYGEELNTGYPLEDNIPGQTLFVDVPRSVAEKYRVSNIPRTDVPRVDGSFEGEVPWAYSSVKMQDKEFFLPREIAAQGKPIAEWEQRNLDIQTGKRTSTPTPEEIAFFNAKHGKGSSMIRGEKKTQLLLPESIWSVKNSKVLEEAAAGDHGENTGNTLVNLLQEIGLKTGKPTVVSPEEFALIDSQLPTNYRGVPEPRHLAKTIYSKKMYPPQAVIHGTGIYTAQGTTSISGEASARIYGANIVKVKAKPGSIVKTASELRHQRSVELKDSSDDVSLLLKRDLGLYAATKNVDVIRLDETSNSFDDGYNIFVNRDAMVVEKPSSYTKTPSTFTPDLSNVVTVRTKIPAPGGDFTFTNAIVIPPNASSGIMRITPVKQSGWANYKPDAIADAGAKNSGIRSLSDATVPLPKVTGQRPPTPSEIAQVKAHYESMNMGKNAQTDPYGEFLKSFDTQVQMIKGRRGSEHYAYKSRAAGTSVTKTSTTTTNDYMGGYSKFASGMRDFGSGGSGGSGGGGGGAISRSRATPSPTTVTTVATKVFTSPISRTKSVYKFEGRAKSAAEYLATGASKAKSKSTPYNVGDYDGKSLVESESTAGAVAAAKSKASEKSLTNFKPAYEGMSVFKEVSRGGALSVPSKESKAMSRARSETMGIAKAKGESRALSTSRGISDMVSFVKSGGAITPRPTPRGVSELTRPPGKKITGYERPPDKITSYIRPTKGITTVPPPRITQPVVREKPPYIPPKITEVPPPAKLPPPPLIFPPLKFDFGGGSSGGAGGANRGAGSRREIIAIRSSLDYFLPRRRR